MHIHNMLSFFLIKMTGAPKGLVLSCIQPRSLYSHSYFRILPVFLFLFHTARVLVVNCAYLLHLFYVTYFCLPVNMVVKKYLYGYQIGFPNNFFICGCFKSISLSCNFGCSSKIGMLTACGSRCKNIYLQVVIVQCT